MSELNLPKCPICHAEERLTREAMERAGQYPQERDVTRAHDLWHCTT